MRNQEDEDENEDEYDDDQEDEEKEEEHIIQTLGGILRSKTRSACSTKFENRGPTSTQSEMSVVVDTHEATESLTHLPNNRSMSSMTIQLRGDL